MPGTATITGKIGPGSTLTSQVLTGVTELHLVTAAETLEVVCNQGRPLIDVSASTTWTLTVSGSTYTLTVT